ncbi:MAG: chromophore lyase CpcT/CpeT, partial [Geitlerinemataceae cyanobacterium]
MDKPTNIMQMLRPSSPVGYRIKNQRSRLPDVSMNTLTLTTLAQWLTGEFENREQAFARPQWFVHLHLWHRPVPISIDGNIALFAEQASVVSNNPPYRQRILVLQPTDSPDRILVRYQAFKHPEKFQGAGANPSLLKNITVADLEPLPGCYLNVTPQNGAFIAQPEPGVNCYFQYDGKQRQVVLGFEVSEGEFKSYDRGVDPETGKGLWGALMGAYEFKK